MNVHVSPSGFPALVLNADFRPLSYYPLSLWSWQDTIKAVFLERVNIVANYERAVHSPSFEMKLPSVVSLKTYVKPSTHPAFTRFNVFLRDRFSCQYCGDREELTFDHIVPRHVAVADAVPADRASPAQERAPVSAQLPARKLARLSLLGYRTGALRRTRRRPQTGNLTLSPSLDAHQGAKGLPASYVYSVGARSWHMSNSTGPGAALVKRRLRRHASGRTILTRRPLFSRFSA